MSRNAEDLVKLLKSLSNLTGLPQVYFYPKKLKHWAYIGSGLYIPELDVIFVDDTIRKHNTYINKYITIYLMLHELAHSTSHPKRLNRKYMYGSKFGQRRSLIKYIKDWDEYYSNLDNAGYDDTLKEYREEIVADKSAMAMYKLLKLPSNTYVDSYYTQYKTHMRNLKQKSSNYDLDKKDLRKETKKCIRFLKSHMQELIAT